MEANTLKPHAIMIPYPLQGHVIPFVRLAMKLATNGFTITFVNTQAIHHQITKAHDFDSTTGEDDIFSGARESGIDIHYVTVNDGFPLGFDRSLNHDEYFDSILHDFSAHVDELVGNLVASGYSSSPNCLIVDTFYVWGSMISKKYNLVNVSFWTEPALVFTLYYHLHLLRENGHFGSHDNRSDIIDYIPGVPAIEPKDLTSYLQSKDTSTVVHRILDEAFEEVREANLVICNTVQDLETETISALRESQPFYAIGPIFSCGFTKSIVPTSLWSESDCTRWLDTKPHGSVLYVSFGSYAHVSKQDVWEIARGLALSQVGFIWVLRPDIVCSGENNTLPIGFEDDVRDKGLVVQWCCQVDVISHPAVGGFLTHCGWNSILESVWCCVPLLCFPLLTDQFTNRTLVVDDWGIGINLCDGKTISREEIAGKISLLMRGKLANEMRRKIKDVKMKVENALSADGSSERNFRQFVHHVKARIQKNNEDIK